MSDGLAGPPAGAADGTPSEPQVFPTFADFLDGREPLVRRAALRLVEGPGGPVLCIAPPEQPERRWPLDDIRRLPDQADRHLMVLSRQGDPLSRLLVEEAAVQRALAARCRHLDRRAPLRAPGRLMAWAGAAVASVALIIFVLVPLLANQLATFMPPAGERALGEATLGQIRSAMAGKNGKPLRECTRPAGRVALLAMQARLLRAAKGDLAQPYPVTLLVLDHKMVNAFTLPGGIVVLFRGLIDEAGSPDEVAAVLAHELGHVAGRDPTRSALRSAGSIGVLGLLLGDFAGGAAVQVLVQQLIEASFSQKAEAAADSYSARLLAAARVHPSALATMFARLRARKGDTPPLLAHFMSHPQLGNRISAARAADKLLKGPARPILTRSEWAALQAICR